MPSFCDAPLNPCLLIPIFDHASTIRRVVESLASVKLPLVIVDDGSGPATHAAISPRPAPAPMRWCSTSSRADLLLVAYAAVSELLELSR